MRSATGRRSGTSRVYSLKPVTLPTAHLPSHLFICLDLGSFGGDHADGRAGVIQKALVLVREDLYEFGKHRVPVIKDPLGLRTSRVLGVPCNQFVQRINIFLVCDRTKVYFCPIATHGGEIARLIE